MSNPLSQLPPPRFVEELSVDTIFQQRLAVLRTTDPKLADNLRVGDPTYNSILQGSLRELHLRQYVNESGKGVMPAYAKGNDLDQLGARWKVERQVIDPGDPDATPPIDPIKEDDERFLERILLAMEGQTNAGTESAYHFHALSSDPMVLDSAEKSPTEGQVLISILSREGDGTGSEELLSRVRAHMMQPHIRQMTDEVVIQSATVHTYRLEARLIAAAGPTASLALEAARAKAQEYVSLVHRMKVKASISGIYAALQQPGIIDVNLVSPVASIDPGDTGSTFCSAIELTLEVANG
ncbi:baseplate assembly protein [Endozoicomonas ascidiicola]|uniref:baseplate assembly protein n=1 Tax=Endozoicomonas ascidiicola TaxID=1698521 RepID=UPI00082E868C|nr:baseplate J/gp47 family protein [Endozoicomonas ascidiicola]